MAKDSNTVIVELKRAHWLGEERHDPGELLEVSFDEALRLIEAGIARRTDPVKADAPAATDAAK